MKKLLLSLFYVLSFDALACRSLAFDAESEFLKADGVAIYTVAGILAANAEAIMLGEEVAEEGAISVPIQKRIRAVKSLDLKGEMEKLVVLDVGCSFASELLWDIVIFKKGSEIRHGRVSDETRSKWRKNTTNKTL